MLKSQITKMPEYFEGYISKTENLDLTDLLQKHLIYCDEINKNKIIKVQDKSYAPGKWTPKDIIQHVIDVERIMCYRALCFARNDSRAIAGFDDNEYAKNALAKRRSTENLIEEFEAMRRSNLFMFKSFSDDMLLRTGTASNKEVSVLAIGFMIVGHQLHHLNILEERYF